VWQRCQIFKYQLSNSGRAGVERLENDDTLGLPEGDLEAVEDVGSAKEERDLLKLCPGDAGGEGEAGNRQFNDAVDDSHGSTDSVGLADIGSGAGRENSPQKT